MPAILNEAVPATTQNVDAEIQGTANTAFQYTALIEHMMSEKDTTPDAASLQLMKEALINSRQHEAFLRVILVSNNDRYHQRSSDLITTYFLVKLWRKPTYYSHQYAGRSSVRASLELSRLHEKMRAKLGRVAYYSTKQVHHSQGGIRLLVC